MESKRTATTYFIPPGKFLLMENALGNPDLIQSSVSSDCRVTIVDKANFPLDELEQWPTFRLVSADIQLKLGSGSYYIYIVVPTPDNEDTTTAFISYNTSLVDRDGYEVIASTDEDGNSVTSKGPLLGKEGFKYYQCGVVSRRGGNSSVTTNPEGQGRLIEVDLGVTPSPSTLPGDLNDFDKIFQLDKVDPSNPASWLLSILTTVKTMVARMVRITGSLVFGQGENERAVTDVATSADKNNEQKIADDVLATTAWTDARFGVLEGKYLRKDQDDRSTGTIASDKGMEVGHFIQGMLGGSGAKMYIDNNGKTIIEADKAYFREELLVPKITFNSIDVVSGEMAQTFAYGTIKNVDTATQIATLDLLDDEYGTLHAYDILRGTFHRLEGGNNTEYSIDKNGFHNYSGFSTSYFTPTEILVNEKGHMEFRYALQDSDGMHPCAGMNFYAYGNFYDKDRQSVTYQTREYTRRLRNMDTWIINPSKNIAMQEGNLNDLEVGNFKMSGWGTFETNSYLMGTQIQFTPDQLEELKGLNGADAYSVTLSSYDGIVKVDAEGNITSGMTSIFNVTTGAMNVVTGDNNVVVTDFRLRTTIQASKGNTPLFYSTGMEEGSYMAFIASVGCNAEISNGVVSVTEITDLKNASLTITVVCEGSYTVEQVYRINAVYDGTKPIIADIDNEMDSVACDSEGNVLFGLPVSCNVSMWAGAEELKIESISFGTPEGVTAFIEGYKVTVSAITKEAEKTLPIGITVTSSYGGKSYTKRLVFTINKIVAGENSLLYKLNPSVAVVKVSNTGEMSVDGVSCDVIAFDGKTTKKVEAPLPSDLSVKYSINGEDKGDYDYGEPVDVTKDDKEVEFKLYNKEVCIDIEGIPVVKDGDSSEIETIYSKLKEPAAPENVHPYVDNDVWSHEVHEDNIWMAVSTRKNNEWTDWQVSRVKGYDAVSYEVSPPVLNLRETLTGKVTPSATMFTCYMSHEDARVEAKAVWGLKGRKTDDGEWDDFVNPYGTEPVSSITFEPNQQNRYVEYLLTATPEGQTTALEVQIISTKDRKGPMPRYCGHFVEGEKYYYNDNYRDIVIYKGNVYQVYPYKPDGYVTELPSDNLSAEGSHDDNWEKANKFSFVAMDTALVDNAHIAGFTFSNNLLLGGDVENPTLTLDGYRGLIEAKEGKIAGFSILDGNLTSSQEVIYADSPEVSGHQDVILSPAGVTLENHVRTGTIKSSVVNIVDQDQYGLRVAALNRGGIYTSSSSTGASYNYALYVDGDSYMDGNATVTGDLVVTGKITAADQEIGSGASVQFIGSTSEIEKENVLYVIV